MQHLIVILIFALCICFVVLRIVRMVSRAKKGDARCLTCTEESCPLHGTASKAKTGGCANR